MKPGRVLSPEACRQLEHGYYFFEDTADGDFLNFDNFRAVAFDEEFQQLKLSIQEQGVKVPIQVAYDSHGNRFKVLAGERRSRAVAQLRDEGDSAVALPVLVHVGDQRVADFDLDTTVTAVVSNLHSQELTQVDKMRCYLALHQKGMTKKQIAFCCGKDRKTVERCLQLAEFDHDALAFIEEKEKSGLLKSRNVEIIGQKLKKSLDDALLAEAKAALPEAEQQDKRLIKQKAKEVALPEEKEKEIRDAAYKVLQEEVKRRQEVKKPKSDATKELMKRKREDARRIDIQELQSALRKDAFSDEQIQRIVAIVDDLHNAGRGETATAIVSQDFDAMQVGQEAMH